MLYKTTRRLFKGTYQYKIVLVCAGTQWFRSGDLEATLENLKKIKLGATVHPYQLSTAIKTQEDLDFALKLQHTLSKMTDFEVRVESPWISIYTNNKKSVDSIVKLDKSKIKYVCIPPDNLPLEANTIIMPKMNYDYRITLGKTSQEYHAFIEWAEASKKIKLTKSAKKDLLRTRSWGGTYFYITGENNLLLAKMHLSSAISKIERIVKQES